MIFRCWSRSGKVKVARNREVTLRSTCFAVITIPLGLDRLATFEHDGREVVVGAGRPVAVALVRLATTVLTVWILVVADAGRNLKDNVDFIPKDKGDGCNYPLGQRNALKS